MLRHGEAADGEPDDERPLTERGARQAEAAGRALARLEIRIDACLTSPKKRALQTAELTCEPLRVEPRTDSALSGDYFDVGELTAGLGDVLLVGHDPTFSILVHDLTGARVRLKKGGLAGISDGELVTLLRPSEMAAIATMDMAVV